MRTSLFEIFKRLTPWQKGVDVYGNDVDNMYPERMDRLINNSVTAKSAANIMVQYLLGKGYGTEADNIIVNKQKNIKLIDFADDLADDLVKHRGAFISVGYNAAYEIDSLAVVPYEWCRVGKKDSSDYNGKIAVYKESWDKPKSKDVTLIDVYNPNPKIIELQVEKAGSWEAYKGQILFVNQDSKLIYPLSRIDSVSNDCDSEAQAAIYKNRLLRKGFFGNTLVVTRPLVDENVMPQFIDDKINPLWTAAESERDAFQNAIKESLGAESVGGVLCLEMDFAGEKLDDAILIKQIDSKIDDKLFNYTESSVRENILVAFNNLPAGLLKTSDNAMFGNSGTAIIEMKRTYQESTTKERNLLTNTLNDLVKRMTGSENTVLQPILLIQDAATTDNPE